MYWEMFKMILKIIGALIALIGIIMVYNSRYLVKKYFNYGEENTATLGMKMFGLVAALIGGFIIYFN
jgi:hypothetical protein